MTDSADRARQFDLVVFDWDGTLSDSTAIIVRCIQAAVLDVGGARPSDTAASYVIGLGLMQALAHAAPDVPVEKYPQLGARYRHHYQAHQHDISLFEGVLPLLSELKTRGHQLAVATGKSRRGLNDALQAAELKGVFDGSRTADETAGKPDPRMLQELMAEFDVRYSVVRRFFFVVNSLPIPPLMPTAGRGLTQGPDRRRSTSAAVLRYRGVGRRGPGRDGCGRFRWSR